ncbi:quaternary amine ABC transporter ATP-binding protein [Frigidibacter sp. ROC022]|uniref:quaternary amine ABC transporter ATP-binding protein n=1 Tax=Frigidibacter sp. ROC022 TaxID=2971796 RepID=UPI00215B20A2|nr:glycine betaine/L-proline ABC transporter ATP-binding protein [Frigidibacter sp. ROC022]MCR8726166.1 glycine betaine/L-proline ABC transporter ATP-binding protein [Frigidibacter sp. ROC022]
MSDQAAPQAKLVCRNLWKLFGARAPEALDRLGSEVSARDLAEAGLVAAVRSVDLAVQPGEVFVIMGLSGSGKSTLVRLMSRLIEPTSGEVLLDGQNLLAISKSEMTRIRRHRMGMVFQHFALLPHLSVLDNVAFPLAVQGLNRAERLKRASAMVELVGLAGREDAMPRQLSGGQQQRVGIARSLAVEPELWFLDEPFSALDPLIRREMQDELMRLQQVLKKTIVFITHDFDEAIRLADRIAIMKDGEIVQCDTPEQVVLNPATDYVREFSRAVPRAKVMRVTSAMEPGAGGADLAEVAGSATVAEAAPAFLQGAEALQVTGPDGAKLGVLRRDAVIRLMLEG